MIRTRGVESQDLPKRKMDAQPIQPSRMAIVMVMVMVVMAMAMAITMAMAMMMTRKVGIKIELR